MRDGASWRERAIALGVFALFCVVVVLPVGAAYAPLLSEAGTLGSGLLGKLFAGGRPWGLLRNSLVIAFSTAVLATVLGVPTGLVLAGCSLHSAFATALLAGGRWPCRL